MKPEFVFCLENASWPALLVDETATIRKASAGAKTLFGGSLDSEPRLAGSLWAKENETTAEQFVAKLQRLTGAQRDSQTPAKGRNDLGVQHLDFAQ
jgi:hypothetical protein